MAKQLTAEEVYRKLSVFFGRQNWWPVTEKGETIPKPPMKKLTERQRFEIAAGAILTQNTSWKNVLKAIIGLNREKLMDAKKIAATKNGRLASVIRSSGYYNQKAKKLKIFCNYLMKEHKGSINKLFKNEKELRSELLGLHGIGRETADSIMLYAGGKPAFVIDAYARRIFSRIGMCSETTGYDELQQLVTGQIRKDAKLYNQYHALLVTLGQKFCTKEPRCQGCPLLEMCRHGRSAKT